MKNGKVIATFLTGLAIGVGIGILFAPDEGKNIRSKIKTAALDLTEKSKKFMSKGEKKNETE